MLHGQSSHQFDQAHLLLIFHFLPFLVTTETIIEIVINISVIEESKFKQLWSRDHSDFTKQLIYKILSPNATIDQSQKKKRKEDHMYFLFLLIWLLHHTLDLVNQNFVLLLRTYIATDPNTYIYI